MRRGAQPSGARQTAERQPEGRGGAAESNTPVRSSSFIVRGSLRGFAVARAWFNRFQHRPARSATQQRCRRGGKVRRAGLHSRRSQ